MSARPLAFSLPFLAPECTGSSAPDTGGRGLAAGSALALCSRHAGRLRVLSGRAWVTLGGPYVGRGNELGDVFLRAGDGMAVPAGARLVVESAPDASGQPLRLDWCASGARLPGTRPGRWRTDVLAPASDLVGALGQTLRALWRLTAGLLGFADLLVAGRGRVLSQWESNPP